MPSTTFSIGRSIGLASLLLFSGCATPWTPATPVTYAAQAKGSSPLLYVSDLGDFDVYIYSVPSLKPAGKLSGFFQPQGECADSHDVWITNTGAEQILEYQAGSKDPVATLADPVGYPVGCALDSKTGNLAVTDIFGNSGPGSVLVYKHAGGTPSIFADSSQYYYYFAGYDDKDNLYVSGLTKSNVYILSELPAGKSKMSTVTVKGATLHFPGSVFWDGSSLVLGDQSCGGSKSSCLYEASVSGSQATVTKTIKLSGSCDVAGVALDGAQIFGGDACPHNKSATQAWAFPAGGKATKSVAGVKNPIGAAIVGQ